MPKIEVSREELREVVEATFRVQIEKGAEISRRFCEETGMPYNPQNEIQEQVLTSLIDPCADYLLGTISEEEFRAKSKQICREFVQASPAPIDTEEFKSTMDRMLDGMTDAVVNSIWEYFSALFSIEDARERNVRYYQDVFQMAKERGIPPVQVVTNTELHREIIRNTMTREEYQARNKKSFILLNSDKLLDMILKPIFGALAAEIEKDGEDPDEIYNQFKEEALQDAALQQQMKVLQDAASLILEEETNKIYG